MLDPDAAQCACGRAYGIPFPVFVRASFGVKGANVPAVLRALVACGWFGIQTWIGGQAIYSMLQILWPAAAARRRHLDLLLRLLGAQYRTSSVAASKLSSFWKASPRRSCLESGYCCCGGSRGKAGGFGPVLSAPSKFKTTAEFMQFFIPSLTGMVGFWATVALNIPDFTRYAKSQKAQMLGQALGLPTAMTLYSFIGVAVTSASVVLFGEAIWDPVVLLGRFHQPVVASIALVALLIATLNTNVAANVVSPSNDFSNLNPRLISFRTGGFITGVVGVLMMPWKLLGDYSAYIFGWLVGYSGTTGPDRRRHDCRLFPSAPPCDLNVDDLYRRNGAYEYSSGVNYRAIGALVFGIAVALLGLVVPALRWLYDYAWFVGFLVAGTAYVALMQRAPARAAAYAGEGT